MNNALFKDTTTNHRVRVGNVSRVVYARHDHENTFVRFVIHKTKAEIEKARRAYLPAKVGIVDWIEVYPHNFEVKS